MNPGEGVLKRLAAVGGKALPDVGRTGVLWQVPERKRRLPGAVRPRDYMAYRSRLFAHSFDIIPNPRLMRRALPIARNYSACSARAVFAFSPRTGPNFETMP